TYLARHGVSAEARHAISSSDLAASDALLSEISDHGADLLVMGGYGHHRMREVLLGGVTRDILRQMTVPVLMSH
ncbi:MAG: universal stress protein, partial [Rhodospirillaceae bacterium]|nr:universal stress protein [Rhodospirillaceae bacterium]